MRVFLLCKKKLSEIYEWKRISQNQYLIRGCINNHTKQSYSIILFFKEKMMEPHAYVISSSLQSLTELLIIFKKSAYLLLTVGSLQSWFNTMLVPY